MLAANQAWVLSDIEAAAAQRRHEAARRMEELGLELQLDTDMHLVVAVLTGGTVDLVPNLAPAGERLAGALDASGGCPRIQVEMYDPPVRQRFSIAHELGHLYLHAVKGSSCGYCGQTTVDSGDSIPGESTLGPEATADAFAGAFLMPASDLEKDISHFGRCVAFLAERYRVSEAAMRRRLATLKVLASEASSPF